MLRMIISFVITLVLVMSPIVGQVIDQQTSLLQLVSSYISDTNQSVEEPYTENLETVAPVLQGSKDVNQKEKANTPIMDADDIIAPRAQLPVEGKRSEPVVTATEVPQITEAPKSTPAIEATSSPKVNQTVKETVAPKLTVAPKVTEAPKVITSPKATATPKATTAPKSTTAPKAAATPEPPKAPAAAAPEPTAAPKPTNAPKQTEAPKPTDSPKATPIPNDKVFDTDKANAGTLGVRYLNTSGKKVKLMVEKEGSKTYYYNLAGTGSLETFPLQSGNGDYKVSIMENTEDNKYRFVLTETIKVSASDTNSAYLGSIEMIKWNSSMAPIKKAAELTAGVSGDEAKVKKIYNYVVKNIRYDVDKLNNLPSGYIPDITKTYSSKSGICYDFASLTAAMLRSIGIPTRLIMGYAEGVNGYHAWNEVYMNGSWVVIDTSYDSQMYEAGAGYSMIKKKSNYETKKRY